VDARAWHWLYDNPDATPPQLREAVLGAAREVWNRYYAPVFGIKDIEILAIYSHMVSYPLYLADYPLGHIIAFQLGEKLRGPAFGVEFERVARQGRLTPDAWMKGAVGEPISTRPLLAATRHALAVAR
jgi:oligoendopeptidase F